MISISAFLKIVTSVYQKENFLSKESDTKNLQSISILPTLSTSSALFKWNVIYYFCFSDQFYFATLRTKPKSTTHTHYFCIDDEL